MRQHTKDTYSDNCGGEEMTKQDHLEIIKQIL